MMMLEPLRFTGLRGELRRNEPLAKHTSWRCGGAADVAFFPADREDLATFVRQLPDDEPVTVIGLGSNLLVRDGGVRGTVVLLHGALNEIGFDGNRIRAEAGVASPKVSRFAALHDRVEVLTRQGAFERRPPEAYVIGYRSVVSRRGADDIAFTAAWFDFPPGNGAYARGRIKALLTQRIATQPLGLPNAGSVFRNPEGDHAARLIESCGLKGFAIGGARVSAKHANFIVNEEGLATAADVEALIGHVRAVVRDQTGVDLEPEVRIIGETR
jgi:UDP-N-acetylmuramate dehydrogenase